jgi:restriction endonuclease S subunit
MAKKNDNNAEIFTIWSDEIESRLDPYFYREYFRELKKELHNCKFTLAKLGDICSAIRGVTYSNDDEVEEGLKILRANNITLATNELNFDDVRNIKIDFPVSEDQQLKAGDILMSAASGSKEHVGKVAYISEDLDFYFGSFMMVLRANEKVNPQYLFEFLSSKIFRGLLFRILGGTNINNLNFTMIKDFEVPLPSMAIQTKIAQTANRNREKAIELENEAKKIVSSIDSFVLSELGIEIERERVSEPAQIWQIWSDAIEKRLDPMFFHPLRLRAIEAIKKSHASVIPLSEVVKFRRELVNDIPENAPYIGLENIVSNSGEYMETNAKESISSAFVFKKGDVLFPKLRPYLNKVFYADFDGICSTEFHVFEAKKCDPYFLFSFLTRSVVVEQTSRLMTGNTLPRLQTEDIENLLIPIPNQTTQEKIVAGVKTIYNRARNLRQEAETVIAEAQKQTAEMIFA